MLSCSRVQVYFASLQQLLMQLYLLTLLLPSLASGWTPDSCSACSAAYFHICSHHTSISKITMPSTA